MEKLTKEEKIQVMRQVTDIVSSVSQSKLSWNLQSIDALVDKLYRQMTGLIEEDINSSKDQGHA